MKDKSKGLLIGLLVGIIIGVVTSFVVFDRYEIVVVNEAIAIKYDKITGKSWDYNIIKNSRFWEEIYHK